MKKILFYIVCIFVVSSCSKDDDGDYTPPYGFNLDVVENSLTNDDWSNNDLKTITINLTENSNFDGVFSVQRETNLLSQNYDYDNFDGEISFQVNSNSVEVTVDPMSQLGYYDFVISVTKNNFKKYISISSNSNTDDKEFLTIWKSLNDNLDPESGNITENQTFEDQLFEATTYSNTNGDLFNDTTNRIYSEILNTNGDLINVFNLNATDIILWKHSEIN